MTVPDILIAICLVIGSFLTLAAGIGLLRFPDAISRLHAATKPQILGLAFVLAAVAIEAGSWATFFSLLPVLALQMVTTPVSGHMIARAGYRTKNFRRESLLVDELAADVDRASGRSITLTIPVVPDEERREK